ncbi:MAG: glycerophosphodiester phosphodiesterase family protein [Clostridia bacterium]|nr:glycerophosphodiester phosphodiesterase family protein [Clostridia bacterium]MDD4376120.1 glycerophosphodiester phosphodiesterase family protein [Clostridia bacterium]
MRKNLSWLLDIKIAHRGLHDLNKFIPENSIIAFEKAINNNVAIELDVHILKDNTIVVFHDDDLKRCCNVDKVLKTCTYNDIENLTLFDTPYKIPTLEEALAAIEGQVPVIIELKTDVCATKICYTVSKILESYKGLFAIKSFSPLIPLWFKLFKPNIVRGMLTDEFNNTKNNKIIKKLFITSLVFLPIIKPDFISTNIHMLKNKKVKRLRKKIIVLGWTFKTTLDKIKYKHLSDGYIFENEF